MKPILPYHSGGHNGKMQLNDLQQLVCKLKENRDMQVETTTLGKFLGTNSTQVSMVLGKEILARPVIVSTREENIQILDLKSGFVISLSCSDDILPKLIKTFSKEREERPKSITSVPKIEYIYREVIKREVPTGPLPDKLCLCRDTMMEPGSLNDRIALIEKTITILECHKSECENGELAKIEKAQDKLGKMITHTRANRLAPGQIPSVYEIAIWSWVN
jgi:hypothetical protein